MKFYAHSLDGKPVPEWHLLDEHLKDTAELAKSFANVFGSGGWAEDLKKRRQIMVVIFCAINVVTTISC